MKRYSFVPLALALGTIFTTGGGKKWQEFEFGQQEIRRLGAALVVERYG